MTAPIPIGTRVRYSDWEIGRQRQSMSGFGYLRPDPRRLQAEEWLEARKSWRGTVTEHILPTKVAPSLGLVVKADDGSTHRMMAYLVQEARP